MTKWVKYPKLEPIRRLKNEGRELLGEHVVLTEKRDGECVSLWIDNSGEVRISSHNLEVADTDIANRMKAVPEYAKAVELIKDEQKYHRSLILYGELLKPVSPTRIEPKRKHLHWVMFDILDTETMLWDSYNKVYQLGYHFKIPVVKNVDEFIPEGELDLTAGVCHSLDWCKKHRREGVVGKVYGKTSIFFKEKIDLPKQTKIPKSQDMKAKYPPMPEDKILRTLQHAYDELTNNGIDWKDKSKAMPVVAKHFSVECKEHYYSPPKNIYQLYTDTPVEKIIDKNGS
jgi:hypothetical protein